MIDKRPPFDIYFLEIVNAVAKRATCDRGRSAAVLVKQNRILATGYVGAPSGVSDCFESGHLFEERVSKEGTITQHCIRTIHAEQNAIAGAARYGVSIEGSTLYCTMEPCFFCAKLIVASGIVKVVAAYQYQAAAHTRELFTEAGIELKIINQEVLAYPNNPV